MIEGLRFGTGFGFGFCFGDFGVCGELTCVGVGAFAAGVEAEAGGVDIEAEPSRAAPFFFPGATAETGVVAGRGLGCVGCMG